MDQGKTCDNVPDEHVDAIMEAMTDALDLVTRDVLMANTQECETTSDQLAERHIVQLIPADGWLAVSLYLYEPWYQTRRLVAWALVEEREGDQVVRSVVGLQSGVEDHPELCDDDCFFEYVHKDDVDDGQRRIWGTSGREWAEWMREQQDEPESTEGA